VVTVFSGLIADVGRITELDSGGEGMRMGIRTSLAPELEPGDSVAVNGACLTVTEVRKDGFSVDVMNQTVSMTSLADLTPDAPVNLELALSLGDRLGGHLVQGHVDGVGEVISFEPDGFSRRLRVSLPPALAAYVIPQGSVAVQGVSLTVTECGPDWLEVSLIPETLERTGLGSLEAGGRVNLECDVIARYVERMVSPYGSSPDRPSAEAGGSDEKQQDE
jgi:riboflavin synthase